MISCPSLPLSAQTAARDPRIVLLGYVILAMHSYFVLEQPAGSLLKKHHRWERFANRVVYVFQMKLIFGFLVYPKNK